MRTHTEKILLVLSAAVLAAIPAFGQKQTPPTGGAPKAFTLPAHETYTLTNGMKVTLVPYGNIPKVSVSLALRAGTLNEPKEVKGVADYHGRVVEGRNDQPERNGAGRVRCADGKHAERGQRRGRDGLRHGRAVRITGRMR